MYYAAAGVSSDHLGILLELHILKWKVTNWENRLRFHTRTVNALARRSCGKASVPSTIKTVLPTSNTLDKKSPLFLICASKCIEREMVEKGQYFEVIMKFPIFGALLP